MWDISYTYFIMMVPTNSSGGIHTNSNESLGPLFLWVTPILFIYNKARTKVLICPFENYDLYVTYIGSELGAVHHPCVIGELSWNFEESNWRVIIVIGSIVCHYLKSCCV